MFQAIKQTTLYLVVLAAIVAVATTSAANAANEPLEIEITTSPTVTGSGVGTVAIFEDAGWLDADGMGDQDASETVIDLRAEIKSQTGTPDVVFSKTGDDARVRLEGAGYAEIEWSVYEAVSGSGNGATGTIGSGNPTMYVKDIDGPSLEHVGAFFNEITSYTVEGGPPVSDLAKTITANQVFFDGTDGHDAVDTEAMVGFTWTDVSTWTIVYETDSGGRNFDHDGDGDVSFINPNTIVPTPALAVTKTENDPDNFLDENDTATYTVSITNSGTGSAFGVNLDDTITGPIGLVDNFGFTNCGSSYSNTSSSLTIDIDDLDVYLDNPCVITYRVTVNFSTSGEMIDNTADVSAADNGGNNPAAVNAPTLTVDTPPTITNDTLANITNANAANYPVSGVCFDDLDTVTVLLTDGDAPANTASTITSCSSGTYSTTVDASSLTNGTVSVSSTIDDGYNPTANDTDNTTMDSVVPTIDQNDMPDINASNVGAYTVDGACSDDGDLVTVTLTDGDAPANTVSDTYTCSSSMYTVTVDATGLIPGTINVDSTIDDGINPTVQEDEDVSKDVIVPTITNDPLGDVTNANSSNYTVTGVCSADGDLVTVNASDGTNPDIVSSQVACGGGIYSRTFDLSSLDDGNIDFTADIVDPVGNAASDTDGATKDSVVPTITQSTPDAITAANVTAYSVGGFCTDNTDSITVTLTDGDTPANTVNTTTACALGIYLVSIDASTLIEGVVTVDSSIDDGINPAVNDFEDVVKDTIIPTIVIDTPEVVTGDNLTTYPITGACSADNDAISVTLTDGTTTLNSDTTCLAGVFSIMVDLIDMEPGNLDVTAAIDDGINPTVEDTDQATMPTDVDDDDTTSEEEKAGPNSGDGNVDGVPDFIQDDVTTKINPVIDAYVTTEISGDCEELDSVNFEIEPNLATEDDDFDYALGLHGFEASCGTVGGSVNVTHYWDQEYDTSAWQYRKFLAATNTYINFDDQVTYGTVEVDGKTVTTVSFSITDGSEFDADGLENGQIVDPIGPAVEIEALSETGSDSRASVVVGSLLVIAVAALSRRSTARLQTAKSN